MDKIGIDDYLRLKPDGYGSLTSVRFSRIEKTQSLRDWYKSWRAKQEQQRQEREGEANAKNTKERIGINDFEPWPDPVNGSVVLGEVVDQIHRFLIVALEQALAIALWIFHSHGIDAASVSPLLTFTSPVPECGKSTAQAVVGRLTPRSVAGSNISSAALFRLIDKHYPTLLIDEADTFVKLSDDMRGILDASHFRSSAFVIRTVGDDFEPKTFSTWCPKAVALIGSLPATLTSRSILIPMKRKRTNEGTERFSPQEKYPELKELGRKIARWTKDSLPTLEKLKPEIPTKLGNNRAADNWIPLLAIADLIGNEWPSRAREAAMALSGVEAEEPLNVELLRDIKNLFSPPADEVSILQDGKCFSKTLIEALTSVADRPWATLSRGKPMSQNTLARILRGFGIKSQNIRIDNDQAKGFYADQFDDAIFRYLSTDGSEPSQPSQANKTEGLTLISEPSQEGAGTDREMSQDGSGTPQKTDLSAGKDSVGTGGTDECPPEEGWEEISDEVKDSIKEDDSKCQYEWVNDSWLLRCQKCKTRHFVAITSAVRREPVLRDLERLGHLGPEAMKKKKEGEEKQISDRSEEAATEDSYDRFLPSS